MYNLIFGRSHKGYHYPALLKLAGGMIEDLQSRYIIQDAEDLTIKIDVEDNSITLIAASGHYRAMIINGDVLYSGRLYNKKLLMGEFNSQNFDTVIERMGELAITSA